MKELLKKLVILVVFAIAPVWIFLSIYKSAELNAERRLIKAPIWVPDNCKVIQDRNVWEEKFKDWDRRFALNVPLETYQTLAKEGKHFAFLRSDRIDYKTFSGGVLISSVSHIPEPPYVSIVDFDHIPSDQGDSIRWKVVLDPMSFAKMICAAAIGGASYGVFIYVIWSFIQGVWKVTVIARRIKRFAESHQNVVTS